MSGFPPDVSVVIPTYNRVDRLRRVLDALEHQTYPHDRFEVVVVSDGSTDGTDAFLESVESTYRIRWFRHPNAGPGATRNRGVSEAQGALVLFVDDDIIATPPLVARHVADHERLGPGHVVIGPMLTPDDGFRMSPWIRWEQAMLYKQYDALERGEYGATDRQFYTGNASVGRRELLALGGFDVTFRRAEDVELARRMSDAGLRFAFDREAIGYHYAERSFTSWLQIARDYGANEVAFAARFGEAEWFARVHHEYGGRHPLVRAAVRLAIVHPALGRGVEGALKAVTLTSARVRPDGAVTSVGLSGLYNVAYFRGMAAALGGASALRRRVVRGRGPRSSAP